MKSLTRSCQMAMSRKCKVAKGKSGWEEIRTPKGYPRSGSGRVPSPFGLPIRKRKESEPPRIAFIRPPRFQRGLALRKFTFRKRSVAALPRNAETSTRFRDGDSPIGISHSEPKLYADHEIRTRTESFLRRLPPTCWARSAMGKRRFELPTSTF